MPLDRPGVFACSGAIEVRQVPTGMLSLVGAVAPWVAGVVLVFVGFFGVVLWRASTNTGLGISLTMVQLVGLIALTRFWGRRTTRWSWQWRALVGGLAGLCLGVINLTCAFLCDVYGPSSAGILIGRLSGHYVFALGILPLVGLAVWALFRAVSILVRSGKRMIFRSAATGDPVTAGEARRYEVGATWACRTALAGLVLDLVVQFFVAVGVSAGQVAATTRPPSALLPLSLITFALGAHWRTTAARLRHQSAIHRLLEDPRPPVLLLRPFAEDDRHVLPDLRSATFIYGWLPWNWPRLEQVIVGVCADVGPVVAIGRPGEPLPQLGAYRMYVEHEDWQDCIDALTRVAACVIVVPGTSKACQWELAHLANSGALAKTVFVFPPRAGRPSSPVRSLLVQRGLLPEGLPPQQMVTFARGQSADDLACCSRVVSVPAVEASLRACRQRRLPGAVHSPAGGEVAAVLQQHAIDRPRRARWPVCKVLLVVAGLATLSGNVESAFALLFVAGIVRMLPHDATRPGLYSLGIAAIAAVAMARDFAQLGIHGVCTSTSPSGAFVVWAAFTRSVVWLAGAEASIYPRMLLPAILVAIGSCQAAAGGKLVLLGIGGAACLASLVSRWLGTRWTLIGAVGAWATAVLVQSIFLR